MTKVIGDYTAANSIDGSTNYLLIQPGNSSTAYKKINRNVFLGVTAQPVDISSNQNLTNKVLDNTNTVTLKDTLFTIQDNSDVTKQARFELSGLTTATIRTYTLPDASTTIVGTGTTQTLTNKTLTAPTITNGSITGTTITTDAIVGQSASTSGTIYGMSISSAKVGSNGVVTASITDAAVTPAKLFAGTGSTWVWQSWTPTFVNWTVGTGGSAGTTARYIQIGKTVFYRIESVLGTSGASVGTGPTFTLPVTAKASLGPFSGVEPIGQLFFICAGSSNQYTGQIWSRSTTTGGLIDQTANTTFVQPTIPSATSPGVWAAGDYFIASGFYEAA